MVDFSKLRNAKPAEPELDPLEVFRSLPKPPEVNDLWDTQAEALRAWHNRRQDTDVVIKLNTGSGKTLVGLLVAESLRRDRRLPCVYLAPNRQLVDQVVEKAGDFGLAAEAYVPGAGFSPEFENGDSTLVCTYHALFNGRTRFGLLGRDEPLMLGGIVLDDAHTSASILRDIFSITVGRQDDLDLYRDLVARFRYSFERVHASGRLDDMLAGRDEGVMEVPYWAWLDSAGAVREQLQALADERFPFEFPLVRDHFDYCHALVSHEAFTITPILPPVHVVPSFAKCERRVFMSATLADDGVLVRTFGASAASLSRPITTRSVAGLGERMILAPSLSSLSDADSFGVARALCEGALAAGLGAVVLVPSQLMAERWQDVGDVCMGDDVGDAVRRLQDEATRGAPLPILVNRYDGIDLPHNACRVLVLDGRPRGANQYDLFRGALLSGMNSVTIALAQRVEQGMGRGTRGAGDHCVVVLLGKDLVGWLGRRDTQQVFTPGTREQVLLGRDIAGHVASADDVYAAARQCLDRDDDWKRAHAERIAAAGEDVGDTAALVAAGRLERRAFQTALYQEPFRAAEILREGAAEENDSAFRGWLLQLAARYTRQAGDVESAETLQADAYASHRALIKPRAEVRYQRLEVGGPQAGNIVSIIEDYAIRGAVLEGIDTALTDLHPEATSNRFEEAIRSLGRFLGFESDRPESSSRAGPDNLWLTNTGTGIVIECKHLKETPLRKEEHGQLRVSVEWFRQQYPGGRAVPVLVHRDGTATPESELVGGDAWVLTFDSIRHLKASLKSVYRELVFANAPRDALTARAAALLDEHDLAEARLLARFLVQARHPSA